MNKDPEAVKQFLAWLLQDPGSSISAPSGKVFDSPSHPLADPVKSGAGDRQLNPDSLDPIEGDDRVPKMDELSISSWESPDKFGDILAVQDRFHALIKRRLRAEIERNPPLFPWETELYDYDVEQSDWNFSDLLPARLWTAHLQVLNFPLPMPESVVEQLFDQCRILVQSPLQQGVKLVQAVESLFPGESAQLNQLAGLVLTSPSRGRTATVPPRDQPAASGFPADYEAATPTQQMVLSLLAARELFAAMTLSVSPDRPIVQRQWLTQIGILGLTIEYHPEAQNLRVQADLPCGGTVQLQSQSLLGETAATSATRSTPGWIQVESTPRAAEQSYLLSVQLTLDQAPLGFVIRLASA